MNKFSIALAAAALIGTVGAAHAVDSNAKFGGSVNNSCSLAAGTDGVLMPNIDSDVLSSKVTGGVNATVAALVTARGFTVRALAPIAFTLGDSTNVTFASNYSLTGSTTASNVAGATATTLNRGPHQVLVDLVATKSTGVFANGTYQAEVTVRCE